MCKSNSSSQRFILAAAREWTRTRVRACRRKKVPLRARAFMTRFTAMDNDNTAHLGGNVAYFRFTGVSPVPTRNVPSRTSGSRTIGRVTRRTLDKFSRQLPRSRRSAVSDGDRHDASRASRTTPPLLVRPSLLSHAGARGNLLLRTTRAAQREKFTRRCKIRERFPTIIKGQKYLPPFFLLLFLSLAALFLYFFVLLPASFMASPFLYYSLLSRPSSAAHRALAVVADKTITFVGTLGEPSASLALRHGMQIVPPSSPLTPNCTSQDGTAPGDGAFLRLRGRF